MLEASDSSGVGAGSDTLSFTGNRTPGEWYADDLVVREAVVPLIASGWLMLWTAPPYSALWFVGVVRLGSRQSCTGVPGQAPGFCVLVLEKSHHLIAAPRDRPRSTAVRRRFSRR